MGGWVKPNNYICLQGGWVWQNAYIIIRNIGFLEKTKLTWEKACTSLHFLSYKMFTFFSSQSNIRNYFKFSSSKGSISDFRKWKQWYKIIFSLKFLPIYPLFNFRKKTLEGVKKHLHSSPFQSIILEILTQISKDLQRFYSFFAKRSKWEVFSKHLFIVPSNDYF